MNGLWGDDNTLVLLVWLIRIRNRIIKNKSFRPSWDTNAGTALVAALFKENKLYGSMVLNSYIHK